MEEFDIREAAPKDAEKIIAYLAQVGGETDYLSFGKEGLPISTEEEEKFIQNINKEELCSMEKWRDHRRCQLERVSQKNEPPRRIRHFCNKVRMGTGHRQCSIAKDY